MPRGYILDSGAPCAFLREDVEADELFFVLGWVLSDLANRILKTTVNHTRNIQSKDFERMPYPWWVPDRERTRVIASMKAMIEEARRGRRWSWGDAEMRRNSERFQWREGVTEGMRRTRVCRRGPGGGNGELFVDKSLCVS